MAEGVIPEVESSLRPHAESADAIVHFTDAIETAFIDEADDRNLLCSQGRGQFAVQPDDIAPVIAKAVVPGRSSIVTATRRALG